MKRHLATLGFVVLVLAGATVASAPSDIWNLAHNTAPAATLRIPSQSGLGVRAKYVLPSDLLSVMLGGVSTYDTTNNRLGIGTLSPGYALDVVSTTAGDFNARIRNSSATGYSGFSYTNASGTAVLGVGVDNANAQSRINSTGSQPLYLMNNSSATMVLTTNHHALRSGSAPTVACTGTGTSPTAPSVVATDDVFMVTMNTGTGSPAATGTCTVTFAGAYVTNMPIPVCMPVKGATAWTAPATIQLTTESLTAPVLTWTNGAALATSTSYKIACHVAGWL